MASSKFLSSCFFGLSYHKNENGLFVAFSSAIGVSPRSDGNSFVFLWEELKNAEMRCGVSDVFGDFEKTLGKVNDWNSCDACH